MKTEAVLSNESVLYDKGWSASVNRPGKKPENEEKTDAIAALKWNRGLASLPPFTDDEIEQLKQSFIKGWDDASKCHVI